jgi:hypothetical protein
MVGAEVEGWDVIEVDVSRVCRNHNEVVRVGRVVEEADGGQGGIFSEAIG